MVANQKTKANACRNGAPDYGEMRVTPGNWAKSNVAPKLMPMVIPMVRANEFSDPATPETLASTAPIVRKEQRHARSIEHNRPDDGCHRQFRWIKGIADL